MSSSYLPVTFCFILYKGINKYLATRQKQFFFYLHQKMYVLVGMVFTSGGQGHFGFYEEGGERAGGERRGKCSSGEVMLPFDPVYLLH